MTLKAQLGAAFQIPSYLAPQSPELFTDADLQSPHARLTAF